MKKSVLFLIPFALLSFSASAQKLSTSAPEGWVAPNVAKHMGNSSLTSPTCSDNTLGRPYDGIGNLGWNNSSFDDIVYYFDVIATNSVTIKDYSIVGAHFTTATPSSVDVYTRAGSWVGNDGSLTGWNFIGSGTFNNYALTWLGLGANIMVPAGATQAFMFLSTDGFGGINVSEASGTMINTTDPVTATNSDLTIMALGIGVSSDLLVISSLGISNMVGNICYEKTPESCAASAKFNLYGLNKLWSNAGANDPNMFYHGVDQWKRMSVNVSGGVGPYTYVWSNSEGYQMKNQNGNQIQIFEPLGSSWAICEVTDLGAGCTFTDSVFIDWTDVYYCSDENNYWKLRMCADGFDVCMPWSQAKAALLGGTATLGGCLNVPLKNASTSMLSGITIYPNPANSFVNLSREFEYASSATLEIVDLSGKLLQSNKATIEIGLFEFGMSVSDLTNGMYMIRLTTDREVVVARFQVTK